MHICHISAYYTEKGLFTDSIIDTLLLDKWNEFNRDRYDGTTDPNEHMDAYTTHMNLYTSDDAVLCRVFPSR